MKILILGHAQFGKDTVAQLISHETNLKFLSSSEAALDLIRPALSAAIGVSDHKQLFSLKGEYRKLWFELIRLLNLSDPTTLTKYVLRMSDISVGTRSHIELEATKHMFSHVIWVDASKRKPLESIDSMNIEFDPDYMELIDNNGSYQDLVFNVKNLVKRLGI